MNPWEILIFGVGWAVVAFIAALAILFIVFLVLETVKVAKARLSRSMLFRGRRRD